MSATETARRAASAFAFALRVRVEDWTGAFKDVDRDLNGNKFFVGASWGEDNDGQGQTAEITLKRAFFQTSVSPFASASPVNKAWGDPASTTAQLFLDVYRRIQIDYYMAAGDEPVGGETWTNIFDGRIDKFRVADGENVVLECRDKFVAELAEKYFEREIHYGLTPGAYAYQKGLIAWPEYGGQLYAVGDLAAPGTLNGFIYRVTAASGGPSVNTGYAAAAEPVWPTTIGTSVVSGGVTFRCDAATAAAGTVTLEQVIQQMLNDSGVTYTWNAPTASSFVVNPWTQSREPILEACKKVALLIGADVRPRWNNSASPSPRFDITLHIPDRAPGSTTTTISADEVRAVSQLDIDIAGVRNAGCLIYDSSTLGSDGKTPLRARVDDKRQTSIDRFGRRWFEISEDASSGIRNATDAGAMLGAALDDMSAPKAELGVDVEFFPWAQLGDYYNFSAHPEHFDTSQDLAIVSYRHEVQTAEDGATSFVTTFQCRGKPSRGYDCWQAVEARPGVAEVHDVVISGGGVGVTITSTLVGGAKFNIQEKLDRYVKWDGAEIHVSKTSGFTPGPSTLVGMAKSADFEVQNLEPGVTYYAKAVPRGLNAGKFIVGPESAEVSFVAGHAEPMHLDPDANMLPMPPNGDFAGALRDINNSPPDRWTVETGSWKSDGTDIFHRTDDYPRSGKRAIEFGTGLSAYSLLSDFAPAIPDQIYAVEMWAKASNVAQTPKLEIVWYDVNRTLISTSTLSRTPAGTNYYLTPYNVLSPSAARWYKVRIGKTSASANTVGVDDVRLRPIGDKWHEVGSTGEPAFQGTAPNDWGNYGTPHETVAFMRDALGFVHLRGLAKTSGGGSGNPPVGTTIFTLPVGYRPRARVTFPCIGGGNVLGRINVDSNGNVSTEPGMGNSTGFALESCHFMADA